MHCIATVYEHVRQHTHTHVISLVCIAHVCMCVCSVCNGIQRFHTASELRCRWKLKFFFSRIACLFIRFTASYHTDICIHTDACTCSRHVFNYPDCSAFVCCNVHTAPTSCWLPVHISAYSHSTKFVACMNRCSFSFWRHEIRNHFRWLHIALHLIFGNGIRIIPCDSSFCRSFVTTIPLDRIRRIWSINKTAWPSFPTNRIKFRHRRTFISFFELCTSDEFEQEKFELAANVLNWAYTLWMTVFCFDPLTLNAITKQKTLSSEWNFVAGDCFWIGALRNLNNECHKSEIDSITMRSKNCISAKCRLFKKGMFITVITRRCLASGMEKEEGHIILFSILLPLTK